MNIVSGFIALYGSCNTHRRKQRPPVCREVKNSLFPAPSYGLSDIFACCSRTCILYVSLLTHKLTSEMQYLFLISKVMHALLLLKAFTCSPVILKLCFLHFARLTNSIPLMASPLPEGQSGIAHPLWPSTSKNHDIFVWRYLQGSFVM